MKETVRIIRFIIVGTLNAVIAALVVWVLMHICRLDYLIANISAYTAAQINNFLWCKYWIFPLDKETKKNSIQRQILFFLIAFAMAYSAQFEQQDDYFQIICHLFMPYCTSPCLPDNSYCFL